MSLAPARRPTNDDRGAAVVEFVMVVGLLLVLFLGVLEIALLLHVRDVMTADAAEGARYEANLGAAVGSGGPRAEQLLGTTLAAKTAQAMSCASTRGGGEVAVTCQGRVGLPFLPFAVSFRQTAHALLEQAP